MGRILMIVGPSQVGKSAAIKELVDHYGYHFITTYTTRAPRAGEIDGRDYHFLTQPTFQRLIGANEFIDWDYFLSSYGGIGRRTFLQRSRRPKVLHVLARMALRIEQRYRRATAVFLTPEDMSVVYKRIRARFADPLIADARCAHADEEMLHSGMFRKVIRVCPTMSISDVAREIHACSMK